MEDCCALYVGSVYVSDYPLIEGYGTNYGVGYGGNLIGHIGRPLGNTENLTIGVDYDARNTFRRDIPYKDNIFDPNLVTVSFSVSCDYTKNKELAFAGDYNQVFINETSVTDEVVVPMTSFKEGDFIAFSYPIVDLSTLVIVRQDNAQTLVLGQDYVATPAGVKLLVGFNSTVNLLFSYDYSNQSFQELQTFINLPKPRGLFFTGKNVSTNKNVTLTIAHVEFNPVSSYEYLGREFAVMNLTANVVPIAWSGSGLSDYFIERRF